MALKCLAGQVSELCIGKPELKWIAAAATISDALTAVKASGEAYISVWVCNTDGNGSCVCVGKFCTADAILFLCREENLYDPLKALQTPLYDILPKAAPIVRHIRPNSSVLEAIDFMLEGTQNLVIPIQNRGINNNSRKRSSCSGHQCCWLTQEDVVRFLLSSVRAFSPIPTFTIESLGVIDPDIIAIAYNKPASSALSYFNRAITEQKSVAVVDEENRLIGEISPSTLASCDETVASAIVTLSAMDLMAYIDCGRPPENLVRVVRSRLEERDLGAMVEMMDELIHSSMSSSSSDDESVTGRGRGRSSRRNSGSRCEAVVCSRGSSLLAVMIKALAHRVCCVWVVEEDGAVVGAVTLAGILNVFRSVAGKSETMN